MSRLEKTGWQNESVPMSVLGSVNIPELSGPALCDSLQELDYISPTLSVDSGRSTSTEMWPSHSYLLHGGPGFSVAVFDSSIGAVSRVPIPVPLSDPVDSSHRHFSLSKITAMILAGESQVWAGTESGSLHVLDLTPEMRFSKHSYTNLPDPVSCLLSRPGPSSSKGERSNVDIIIGSPNGNLTIISGERNERRGLKNSLKCPRKLIQLGVFEEGGSTSITCVTLVMCEGVEVCWCGCGGSIVVLRCSDWREVARLNVCEDISPPPDDIASSVHVSGLLVTEGGVWSTLSHSSSLTLWDKERFTPKITITCCDSLSRAGWLHDTSAQISAISYSYPLLFAGTKGGHIMVFRVQGGPPTMDRSPHTQTKLTQRIVAGTHCGSNPVIGIYPIPLQLENGFPSPVSPTPVLNVLIVCGSNDTSLSSSVGQIHLYELVSSPHQSPLTSPMNISGRQSSLSSSSLPLGSSSRLLRKSSIDECGSLPPLSLTGASLNSASLLPLGSSD